MERRRVFDGGAEKKKSLMESRMRMKVSDWYG
jgi:hypothetical protein